VRRACGDEDGKALSRGVLQQHGGCSRRSSRLGRTESSGDHQLFSISQERRNHGRGGVSACYDAKTEMVSVNVDIQECHSCTLEGKNFILFNDM